MISFFNNIFCDNLFPLDVNNKRKLFYLHANYFFIFGLIFKLFLVIFAIPKTHLQWFLPFFENSIINFSLDPWNAFLTENGNSMSFPYGFAMYFVYLPLTYFGSLINSIISSDFFLGLGFRLSTLIFDYVVLIFLSILTKNISNKILLFSYWCSPLIIYINYFHGQLDIVPIMFLVCSICMINNKKYKTAGIFFSLAISSKLSMIIAFPLIMIYLCHRRGFSWDVLNFLIFVFFTLLILIFPYSFSIGYQEMVFKTPEIQRLFMVSLSYGLSLKVYVVPIVYLFTLYLIWRLKRITQDLFLIATGLSFFSLLIFLPPASGWLLWTMPFLVYYQIISRKDFLGIGFLFVIVALINNILYSSGASLFGFNYQDINNKFFDYNFNDSHFKNLLFTAQQGLSFLLAIRMYIYGLKNNSFYKVSSKPLVISIKENINLNIDHIENMIQNLLGKIFTSSLSASNYIKREMGVYNFSLYAQNEKLELIKNVNEIYPSRIKEKENFGTVSNKFIFFIKKCLKNIIINKVDYLFIRNDIKILPINIRKMIDLDIKFEKVKSLKEIDDMELPFNTSSIFFYFVPIGFRNKETLITYLPIGFLHEQLLKLSIAICALHVETEITSDNNWVKITFEGEAKKEDIAQISQLIIPRLSDLKIDDQYWASGNLGLIQIIILAHISDILQNNNFRDLPVV